MRVFWLMLPVFLTACAGPNALTGKSFSPAEGEAGARQQCVMLMTPYIPAGTPNVAQKLTQLPDTTNGLKVLRYVVKYNASSTKVDARCQYKVGRDGVWSLQRLMLSPRYPAEDR